MSNQETNLNLANYIITLATKPNAKENIALLLESLFDSNQKDKQEEERLERAASSIVTFSKKEIEKMPQKFRKIFKTGKARAHVRLRKDNIYEIKWQFNNEVIIATSKHLDVCKEKLIEKLAQSNSLSSCLRQRRQTVKTQTPLIPYMEKWLETTKKPFIKEVTYKEYVQTVRTYIVPQFNKRTIESVQAFEIQEMLNEITESGRNRTAKKIYQLLSPLFEYAVADGIITLNPMAKVRLARYEVEHGTPLTKEEELTLIQTMKEKPLVCYQAYVFMMYTGLRRSELASVEIDDNWITLTTGKQRKGMKEKNRSLPISPMLRKVLPFIDVEKIKTAPIRVLTDRIKDVFENHHLHDLRHTFITRAQECGIRREIVSLWAGHKADSSITTTVYTHFQERSELQLQEMEKYNYEY
jgi:integrase